MTRKQADAALRELARELGRIDRQLEQIAHDLPGPDFERGTDTPLNPAAELIGLLSASRQEDIAPALAALERAVTLSAEL